MMFRRKPWISKSLFIGQKVSTARARGSNYCPMCRPPASGSLAKTGWSLSPFLCSLSCRTPKRSLRAKEAVPSDSTKQPLRRSPTTARISSFWLSLYRESQPSSLLLSLLVPLHTLIALVVRVLGAAQMYVQICRDVCTQRQEES